MILNIHHLNKVFESRIRLGVMSALMVHQDLSFNEIKELLNTTDGNLATHLRTLEEHKYVSVSKGFIGRKTNTIYSITELGQMEFRNHILVLENLFKNIE